MTGASVGITNAGTFTNGSYTAGDAMTVTNSGKLTAGKYTAKAGTMDITNQGTIEGGAYTAHGDLTYTDTADASLLGGTLISEEGKAKVTAHGVLLLKKLTAKQSATVEADHDVTLTEAEAGTLAVSSGGSVKADTLTATAGDASVNAKTDVTIGTLKAEAGAATVEATEGALNVGTLTAKDAAKLTSGGAMEVTHASAGSVNANAGTTLHVAKLVSTGKVVLTSKDEATLDDVTAGTLNAESKAGSVNAGTLTATVGDASVKAKKDVMIGTLTAEAGVAIIEATDGALNVGTLTAKDAAKLTSGGASTLGAVTADSVTANAGTTLDVTKLTATKAADLTSGSDMVLTEAHANTLTAKAGGKLTATTLGVTGAAGLTSGGAMEVTDANVGSVAAKAGSTLHVKKLTSTGEATLTSKDEATLDDVTVGTLAAESKAGSVDAGTLTATTGDASVTAKTDVTIGMLKAEAGSATIEATEGALGVTTLNAKNLTAKAGTTLSAKTLDVKEHAELTSGSAMTLESANADSLTANAGMTLDATKIHTAGDAGLASGSDMILHEAEAGGKLTASAGGSISVKGMDAKISGSAIEMTAKEDIRITDRSLVGKLDGVDTSVPAGSTTGSGAAGSLVTGEAKPHDFDASGKGSALLSSAGGKVTLSAKKVEIDTLKNGEGNAADLKISADNIGIDDLAGTGAQHVTILGANGQSQAHYAGIHSTAEGGTLVKDSAVEHLELTGREPLGLSNTAIGGDSLLATDKIRVTIQKNPGSSQAEHFGNLSLSGYDIATDHVMTSVKDGLTVNGERFPVTAESVMNASLYEDRTLGRDGREKEEEAEKDSPSLAFGAPNEKEAYEVVK